MEEGSAHETYWTLQIWAGGHSVTNEGFWRTPLLSYLLWNPGKGDSLSQDDIQKYEKMNNERGIPNENIEDGAHTGKEKPWGQWVSEMKTHQGDAWFKLPTPSVIFHAGCYEISIWSRGVSMIILALINSLSQTTALNKNWEPPLGE